MRKTGKIGLLTAGLIGIFIFGAGSALAEESGGTFTYLREAAVTSFDLHQEITENNAFAIDKVFEPLVTFEQDGMITDWLAASHTISEDGLVYTFVLQDGLKFSDGTDVTAEDVKFSIERHLEVGGPLPIEAGIVSVEAKDEKTVVITLEEAYTPFLSELANFSNSVIPKDFGGRTEEEFFQNPVGTGPFVVESWDPAGDLVFRRNEYYWQEGKPLIDELIYKVVEDDNQVLNQLLAGEADAVDGISYGNVATVENGADTDVLSTGGWEVEELFFNTLDEHFADVHVRRALAYAIDREALTQALTFGCAQTANTVLPRAIRYSTSETAQSLGGDIEAAKAELAQSAFPDGFETEILVPSGNNTRLQEAQIIQSAAEQLGIVINIHTEEVATFRDDFMNYNYSIMLNSAMADYPDADSIMAFQVDPEGFSKCYWTNYTNEEAVELMHQGQKEPDGDSRAEIYAKLQDLLAQEVPYIPLYETEILVGVRSNIEGLSLRPNGSARFEDVVIGE